MVAIIILGSDDTFKARADVNGDGTVDVSDINEVLNIMMRN